MKKGYLCSDKIQKRMKSKNIQRLTRFLDHRSSNWQQRLCLIIFLTLCLTVIVAGVPMHIMGIVGRSSGILYAISALMWLMTVVLFVLYMTRRMSLKIAISTFGLLIQLTGSARIVYMAIERPEGFDQTILFNQIISLALIIYLVMAVVRLFDGDSGWCAYAHHGNSRTQQWHTVCHIGSDVVDDSGAVCFVYDASYVVEDSYIHIWIVDTADRQCSHCVYGYRTS